MTNAALNLFGCPETCALCGYAVHALDCESLCGCDAHLAAFEIRRHGADCRWQDLANVDYRHAVIACACGYRVLGDVVGFGSNIPATQHHADESESVEIDVATDCPNCGADLCEALSEACDRLWNEWHGGGRR